MKKNIISILFSILSILLITRCAFPSAIDIQSTSINKFKKYYYPVSELKEPRVYHYKPKEENFDHLYWILSRVKQHGKVVLTTDSYVMDRNGNIKRVETIKEEINEIGAIVKQYVEIEYDEFENHFEVHGEINNEWVFKWNLIERDSIIWDFKTESKLYPGYVIKTQRTRNLTGQKNIIQFKGEDYNTITFLDSFSVEYVNSKLFDKQELDFKQTSIYAEGIGLYQYVRDLPDNELTYTLVEILSVSEWKNLKNKK